MFSAAPQLQMWRVHLQRKVRVQVQERPAPGPVIDIKHIAAEISSIYIFDFVFLFCLGNQHYT